MATEADIKEAFDSNAQYFRDHIDSVSLKSVLICIEKTLSLEKDALKPQKAYVKSLVENFLNDLFPDADGDLEEKENNPCGVSYMLITLL